jgi:hypothetical protein
VIELVREDCRVVWLTSCLILCLILAGCVTRPEMGWIRADGKAVVPIQFEADNTVCNGEVEKARAAYTGRISASPDQIFSGCMAEKGYLQRPLPAPR